IFSALETEEFHSLCSFPTYSHADLRPLLRLDFSSLLPLIELHSSYAGGHRIPLRAPSDVDDNYSREMYNFVTCKILENNTGIALKSRILQAEPSCVEKKNT
ncbi:hypothetical protein L9F63_026609, partial [Diploptera punctata]